MNLDLIRHTYTDWSTIGSLACDGVFECFVLENPLRLNPELGPEHIAIPFGHFQVIVRHSERFHREVMGLCGVPNRTEIEIHPGNASKDTHGCLLPGKTRAKNFVGSSMEAFEGLLAKVKATISKGEEVWIDITASRGDTDANEVKQG